MKRAVIFDLDGVLVSTHALHARAWARLAGEVGVPFDAGTADRLRGIGRAESLAIVLGARLAGFSQSELRALAERKNGYYVRSLDGLTSEAVLPGALEALRSLHRAGVPRAVASASRNAALTLEKTGLAMWLDVVVDGNNVAKSKPDPEVFLLGARRLGVSPSECVVIEDAPAGVEGARRAGMRVVAVGNSALFEPSIYAGPDLSGVDVPATLHCGGIVRREALHA